MKIAQIGPYLVRRRISKLANQLINTSFQHSPKKPTFTPDRKKEQT
jgi:hypothetical protein